MRVSVTGCYALFLLAACSSETSTGSGGDAGGAVEAAVSPGDADAATSAKPGAPKLDKIMKMTGGLHVFWTNPPGTDCDKIEGERKTATAPYKVAFTVPGAVDNKHDGTATDNTTYTYRLRCKVGDATSDPSNELGANPQ